jgi:hypothetical protein
MTSKLAQISCSLISTSLALTISLTFPSGSISIPILSNFFLVDSVNFSNALPNRSYFSPSQPARTECNISAYFSYVNYHGGLTERIVARLWTAAHAFETLSVSTFPMNRHAIVSVRRDSRSVRIDGDAEFVRIYIASDIIARNPASCTSWSEFWIQEIRQAIKAATRSAGRSSNCGV